MLQPKRTKFRKAHKGRIHGNAPGGTSLNFGSYGLKAHQLGACLSLLYNIGEGNFASSTLLRKIKAYDTAGAAEQFPRWNKAQPRIYGAATFEWNAVEGTTWFSPEWAAITQSDDYDWTRPNDDDWWTLRVHPNDMPVLQRACLAILAGKNYEEYK